MPAVSLWRQPAASTRSICIWTIWRCAEGPLPVGMAGDLSPDCGDRAVDYWVDRLCGAREGGSDMARPFLPFCRDTADDLRTRQATWGAIRCRDRCIMRTRRITAGSPAIPSLLLALPDHSR